MYAHSLLFFPILAKNNICHFIVGGVAVGVEPLLGAIWGPIYASAVSGVIFKVADKLCD